MSESPVLAPLDPGLSRSDLVAGSIREAILQGRLQPGVTLVERKLAELLGVSKTPVREALISLTATGLVINTAGRATVRRLELADIRKVFELRLLLEPWAAAAGCAQPGNAHHTAAKQALDGAKQLLDGDDHVALSLANRRFHRTLYSYCDNELVTAQLDQLQDLLSLGVVSMLWQRSPTWRKEYDEHRGIVTAVRKRDGADVERQVRAHIEGAMERLQRA